jgi:hypothetical protein
MPKFGQLKILFYSKVVKKEHLFDQNPMLWIENESQQQELRDKIVAAQNYYQLLILIML